ncbi:MAG TPA: NUDIX hydrolase [Spirochaetota bacterium]|nr:NUDIX hydrolase [Spirochaetota bacterium]
MTDSGKNVRIRVCGILIDQDKLLLIAHRKNNEIYWLLPGGGVDYGESLKEALCREFHEELNVSIDVDEISMVSDSIDPEGNRHVVNLCFACRYESGEFRLGDDERLYDFRFFTENEIKDITIYPPINDDLVSIMREGFSRSRYIGKLWK